MTLRPLGPADLEAAHALWMRSVPGAPLSPEALADLLWGEGARPLAADRGGRLAGLASGASWDVPGERRGSVRAVVVAPEARRQGLGAGLLAAVEAALREAGATEARLVEGAPVYLAPGVDDGDDDAKAFAVAQGYTPFGEAVNLAADLRAPLDTAADEARLADAGVAIRRATSADAAGLQALLAASWPAWQAEADHALAQVPPPLHIAARGGRVVGFAAHSVTPLARGRFGPMGTDPAARGLGIGAVLLRRCLRDLHDAGHARAIIGWAAALPFYAQAVGATVDRRYRRFARTL